MKYLLAMSVFGLATFLPVALSAQTVTLVSGSPSAAAWVGSGSAHDNGSGINHPYDGGSRAVVFPSFFGYPPNYPFSHFYPGMWAPLDEEYQQAWRIAHGDVDAEVAAQQKDYLAGQVQALADEVQSLRQERASRSYAQPPAAPPQSATPSQISPQVQSGAEEDFPATAFIYQDGRTLQVRDYAIIGETLWVFHGNRAQKFPLADFNLAASRQVNEEHGVEFPLADHH